MHAASATLQHVQARAKQQQHQIHPPRRTQTDVLTSDGHLRQQLDATSGGIHSTSRLTRTTTCAAATRVASTCVERAYFEVGEHAPGRGSVETYPVGRRFGAGAVWWLPTDPSLYSREVVANARGGVGLLRLARGAGWFFEHVSFGASERVRLGKARLAAVQCSVLRPSAGTVDCLYLALSHILGHDVRLVCAPEPRPRRGIPTPPESPWGEHLC